MFHHSGLTLKPCRCCTSPTCLTFAGEFAPEEIRRWLRVFIERFYRQQFKRTTLPPGPKVGSVSLSPRGDLRMPDEVDPESLLRDL